MRNQRSHRIRRDRGVAEPVAASRTRPAQRYSRELIEETIKVWQPYYDTPLTETDAREIISNMTNFAAVLLGLSPADPLRAGTFSKSDKSLP